MEIRHTIEILTKDIQDIEKLVGNLQNSPGPPAIELDLAMSKLRNVYEVLTLIKTDLYRPGTDAGHHPGTGTVTPAGEARKSPSEEASTEEPKGSPSAQEKPTSERKPAGDRQKESPESGPGEKKAEILAEQFSAESSINEDMAGKRSRGIDTRLVGQPINNIGRNIGINDRFLIIRELFDGDSDRFGNFLVSLDNAGSFTRAEDILRSTFEATIDHEGVEILASLVKRRYPEG